MRTLVMIFASLHLTAFAQTNMDLLYCQQSANVITIKPMDDGRFVGVADLQSNGLNAILFNQNHLPTDSLVIDREHPIEDLLYVIGNKKFLTYINSKLKRVDVVGDSFVILDQAAKYMKIIPGEIMLEFHTNESSLYLWKGNEYFLEFNTANKNHRLKIPTPGSTRRVKPHFFYDSENKLMYVSMDELQALWILDIDNEKAIFFRFNHYKKVRNWKWYFDYNSQTVYALVSTKKGTYILEKLNSNFAENIINRNISTQTDLFEKIDTISFMPHSIINEKYHVVVPSQTEGLHPAKSKEIRNCHYFSPIRSK